MIYSSRDYSFREQLDYRFTQYRCPACSSYHVAIVSVVNWPDASAIIAVGEGEIECQDCQTAGKGKIFQRSTQSHSDGKHLNSLMLKLMKDTGDKWNDLNKPIRRSGQFREKF